MRDGQGLIGWVARNRRRARQRPARGRPGRRGPGRRPTPSLQSALVCPLIFNDGSSARSSVYHTEPSTYTDDHGRLLDRISEQAAAVIHHSIVFERTQEDSLTDPLTGLPNTRFMFMHLARELARADRLRSEVSLLVMDLDGFKDINDTYGHHVGDRALREVGQALQTVIRPYDICVRYAGDEFIVVLSGCAGEEAETKRLDLQQAIDDLKFEVEPRQADCRSRSARARRSSRTTAIRTKRCWPRRTAGCTATRRAASGTSSRTGTDTDRRGRSRCDDRRRAEARGAGVL